MFSEEAHPGRAGGADHGRGRRPAARILDLGDVPRARPARRATIVNRLSQEANKAVNEPEIKSRFTEIGIEPVGGTPEQTAKFLDDEIAKWAKVITTAGVKAEQ